MIKKKKKDTGIRKLNEDENWLKNKGMKGKKTDVDKERSTNKDQMRHKRLLSCIQR